MAPPLESWQFESFLSSRYCYSTSTLRYCYSYDSPTFLRDGSYATGPMLWRDVMSTAGSGPDFFSSLLLRLFSASLRFVLLFCNRLSRAFFFPIVSKRKVPSPGFEPSSLRANSPKARINPRGHGASLFLLAKFEVGVDRTLGRTNEVVGASTCHHKNFVCVRNVSKVIFSLFCEHSST